MDERDELRKFEEANTSFSIGKLVGEHTFQVYAYSLESNLGILFRIFAFLIFAGINLYGLSQGRLPIREFIEQGEYTSEHALHSLAFFMLAYSFYLLRDKNKYQSLAHDDLDNLRSEFLKNRSKLFEITDYLDKDVMSILTKFHSSEDGKGHYRIADLLKLLTQARSNESILARLGWKNEQIATNISKLVADNKLWSKEDLLKSYRSAFVLAVDNGYRYFDERSLLLSFLLNDYSGELSKVKLDLKSIEALVNWQKTRNQHKKLMIKIMKGKIWSPFSTVNPSMTSIYSPSVENFTDDITNKAWLNFKNAKRGKAAKVDFSFREKEIDNLVAALASEQGLALVIGESGVGKTTMLRTLAFYMIAGEVPAVLKGKRFLSLNIGKLLTEVKSTSDISSHLEAIFMEQERSGNIVLAIEDIDELLNLRLDLQKEVISILTGELKKVQVRLVSTITPANYKKYFLQNDELAGMFRLVNIEEATPEDTLQVLFDSLAYFEKRYGVKVEYTALKRISESSSQYDFSKHLPDKAIDILEESMQLAKEKGVNFVNLEFVDEYLEKKSGLRLGVGGGELDDEEKKLLEHLDDEIRKYVVGQREAVVTVSKAIKRARVGLNKIGKPIASFLFYGPTGVGKTELSKTIARVYFGDEKLLLRLDMSEFQGAYDIKRLIGFYEHNQFREGQLTQFVLQHPFCVILLDELEKADKGIVDVFLQVLDNAKITDGAGREVDFQNVIVVATSNAGSRLIAEQTNAGKTYRDIKPAAFEKLKDSFRLEFLNRFDAVVMFHPLSTVDVEKITEMQLFEQKERLKARGIEFVFSDNLVKHIASKGYDPQFGARALKRKITEMVEDQVAEAIVKGDLKTGDIFSLE